MLVTDDPNDPCLNEIEADTNMQVCYLVLSDEEREKGFVRPVRTRYVHSACGAVTTMGLAIAETYARDPYFYGGTYCARCRDHFPVGPSPRGQFVWAEPRDGTPLGEYDRVGT
jgi:hypothetical protein